MPLCLHETGLEIHHIDENPENNEIGNLLMLCAVHHSQATKGAIDKITCQLIKRNLNSNQSYVNLNGRYESVKMAIYYLNNENHSYRNIAAGPFLFNPDWYMNRRNELKSTPNFDSELFKFVLKNSEDRNSDIRLMFSLSSRYIDKVNEIIIPTERARFIEGIVEKINLIFGDDFEKGPDVCCYHSGNSSIDMIFDDAIISTYRINHKTPTMSYNISRNQHVINLAKTKFDTIFDANSKGQKREINKLIDFVKNLWPE